jgi:hypothetical protein
MRLFKSLPLILLFLSFPIALIGQTNDASVPPKIDLNLNFNIASEFIYPENQKDEVRVSSTASLLSIYPLAYKKMQFGLGFGFETANVNGLIKENRVPLMAVTKVNFFPENSFFIKAQLGTAATLESKSYLSGNSSQINSREDIGAPIIANLGLGFTIPLGYSKLGFEIGYASKQFGYKKEYRYNNGAVFFGFLVSLP